MIVLHDITQLQFYMIYLKTPITFFLYLDDLFLYIITMLKQAMIAKDQERQSALLIFKHTQLPNKISDYQSHLNRLHRNAEIQCH